MKDPLPVCDFLDDSECQVMQTGEADDCLWLQMTEDDGAWYVEVYPDGIAYTVWEKFGGCRNTTSRDQKGGGK